MKKGQMTYLNPPTEAEEQNRITYALANALRDLMDIYGHKTPAYLTAEKALREAGIVFNGR